MHFGIGIRVLCGVWMTLETVALAVASESRGGAVTSVMAVEPSAALVPSTATLLKQNQF